MSAAEDYARWKDYAAWDVSGSFEGVCRGGPYDGQKLKWSEPHFMIRVFCSTAEYTPEQLNRLFENIRQFDRTQYVWTDSTWVWMK